MQTNREILAEKEGQDQGQLKVMLETVYPELRRIARHRIVGERKSHTLQATALTNEVIVRLLKREVAGEDPKVLLWNGLLEMRRILIDSGRRWQVKRRYEEASAQAQYDDQLETCLHTNLLLDRLEKIDARARKVFELRCFLGLTNKECSKLMGLSMRSVGEDWEFARSWLALNWGEK